MARMNITIRLGLLLLALVASGCNASSEDVLASGSDVVTGTIASVVIGDNNALQILVEDALVEGSQSHYDSLVVFADADTQLFARGDDGTLSTIIADDVTGGNIIRAYFDGTILRSLPPGVGATRIEITFRQ